MLFIQFFRRIKFHEIVAVFGTAKYEISTIYIINLDRQVTRWEKYKKEASFQRVKEGHTLFDYSNRISAIDGKKLDLTNLNSNQISRSYKLVDQYIVDHDPRYLSIIQKNNIIIDLTKEEIAIALSHIKIWKKIVAEKLPYVLILEDDVFFESDFGFRLNHIWQELSCNSNNLPKFDLLYLSFWEVEQGVEKEILSNYLFRPLNGLLWLSGYVLSFSGANKILNELPIYGPVDVWINHIFEKLQVFASTKSIINQRKDMKSDNNYSILPILSVVSD